MIDIVRLVTHQRSGLLLGLILQAAASPGLAYSNHPASEVLSDRPIGVAAPAASQQANTPLTEQVYSVRNIDTVSQPAGSPESGPEATIQTSGSPLNVPCLRGSGTATAQGLPLVPANNACAPPLLPARGKGLQFGRRLRTQNNMLGDLDGLLLDYGFGNFSFNGIAGFPAGSGGKGINPSRQLLGFSAGIHSLPKGWDLGGYMMESRNIDQNNRSALGGAIRYSQNNRSLLISADYDLLNRNLSRFMVSGAWKWLPSSTLSTTLDIRQSNLPTPQNSYLQETIALTEGWKWGLPFDRINDLSADTANEVAALGFSVSHDLSHNLKLNSDIAVLNVSNEHASIDLKSALSDFNEYYFNLTLSGRGLLLLGDDHRVTRRSYISDTSRLSSSMIDGSIALSHKWHLAPRLQIDYHDNLAEHSTPWVAAPALKMEYRWRKQSVIRITTSSEWRKSADAADESRDASYVVSLGYQAAF